MCPTEERKENDREDEEGGEEKERIRGVVWRERSETKEVMMKELRQGKGGTERIEEEEERKKEQLKKGEGERK